MTSAHVDQTQDEGGQGEGRESQRSRVAELAPRPIRTRLGRSTERRNSRAVTVVAMGQWFTSILVWTMSDATISLICSGNRLLGLLGDHVSGRGILCLHRRHVCKGGNVNDVVVVGMHVKKVLVGKFGEDEFQHRINERLLLIASML